MASSMARWLEMDWARVSLGEGQGPVVTIVGYAQEDFFRRDFCDSVVQHRPDVGERGDRHGWAVGITTMLL